MAARLATKLAQHQDGLLFEQTGECVWRWRA